MASYANGTNVVFLHGYNVNAEEARAWHSEMFKRLWQSGSKARFHGVTWRGDIGGINVFRYHEDVVSAFATAPHLKNYVNRLLGQKVIMAHSLGNMVVSSAIADHGMDVHKYFMLNAAVASEAFDANLWNDSPSNVLVHEDWRDYTNVCWSTKWHMFFVDNSDDARACLTWKDRFVGVLSKTTAYNFFSSGDEVFELYDGTPYTTSGMSSSNRRYAWHKQETHKGCGAIDPAGTSWSGWRFRLIEVKNDDGDAQYRNYTADEAALLAQTPGTLVTNTVFDMTPVSMDNPDMDANTLNAHLAKGIPALSPAAGISSVFLEAFRFDMNTQGKLDGGTWGRDHEDYGKNWLHSDMKNMAFLYTHRLFKKLVDEGGLR